VSERVQSLRDRIAQASLRCGRAVSDIKLIAVSKKQSAQKMRDGFAAGVRIFGENYVQEALVKQTELSDLPVEWHFVGALQTNKVKAVVGSFAVIHSVDRLSLAQALAKRAEARGVKQRILIEVNVAGEATKSGVALANLPKLFEQWSAFPSLAIEGLMAMPPFKSSPLETAQRFRAVREAGAQLGLLEFSMGTSTDFEIAIAEGSTMVRIGTDLFGPR
jgi:pyridoxal phosphate enzyme (YggS family)